MNNWHTWDYSNDEGPFPPNTLVEWEIADESTRNYNWGTVKRVDELSWEYDEETPELNIVKYRKINLN